MDSDAAGGARLQRELLCCWLALSVAQLAERALAARRATSVTFAAVGRSDPGGDDDSDDLHTAQSLAQFVAVFAATSSLAPPRSGREHDRILIDADNISRVDCVAQVARDGGCAEKKKMLVLVGACGSDQRLSDPDSASLSSEGFELVVLLSRESDATSMLPWKCSLIDLSDNRDDADALPFLWHPLEQLDAQCGSRIALEVLSWITSSPPNTPEQEPTPLFKATGQLPFQLLLLLLRWSFFHPSVVGLLGKKLRRQLDLTPASRIHRDVRSAQEFGRQLWRHLYPETLSAATQGPIALRTPTSISPVACLVGATTEKRIEAVSASLLTLDRLSRCQLWNVQKQFYLDRGIQAWSSGVVPFGVSSSSFIAAAYARVAVNFLLSQDIALDDGAHTGEPNCFVWEAASGSCKFLHHFLLHFYEHVKRNATAFRRRKLVPLVVASDLSDQVLASRMRMPCFQPYLEQGKLEFARFDTAAFVSGPDTGVLRLKRSGRSWQPGQDGSLFFMGNYFFDSLRTDVFALTKGLSATDERCFIHEAVIDPNTLSIAEMDLVFRPAVEVDGSSPIQFFESDVANTVLHRVIDEFRERESSDEHHIKSVLVLFPTEAVAFLSALTASTSASRHSIAVVAGDAGFSFRDAISSAFLTPRSNHLSGDSALSASSLELPQLSPHPDCFCLPVDFEVFRFVIEALGASCHAIASAQTASTLASDTFDVFYATLTPVSARYQSSTTATRRTHVSFTHEFASFTPGDCDLLWGMMSVDDGARHFSTASQLALMAQSAWDFDLFAAVQWPLAQRWRAIRRRPDSEPLRLQLVAVGVHSWRTYYELEDSREMAGGDRKHDDRMVLQVARWFYVLQAYDVALRILRRWAPDDQSNDSSVNALYLTGLSYARLEDHWKALALFRKCAHLAPTHLKIQTRIAATLLELQHLRHDPQE